MTLERAFEAVGSFMETGGSVLTVIFAVTLLMWTLILERLWFMRLSHPRQAKQVMADWAKREDHTSWYARATRRKLIAELADAMNHSLPMIKTLVALCPLLGLLGTVTGMIEVFQVMAVAGNGNPRAMASGVSMATIPTMAGMVAAISGLYMSAQLHKFAQDETRRVSDAMTT